jgi:hypothetical protein
MMIDLKKALTAVAANAEVKKFVGSLREKGVADALITLGLASRPGSMLIPGIGLFAAGAVCGAAAALLVTPRTGEAFRQDIQELLSSMREKVDTQVQDLKTKRAETRNNGASASS